MFSILIINLLLGHFDNKLFFDEEYIKFLKYKNSFIQIKHKTIEPNYKFYKRTTPEYKEDNKIKLFEVTPKLDIFKIGIFKVDISPSTPQHPFQAGVPGSNVYRTWTTPEQLMHGRKGF
jgi:hypothetical protein